MLTFAPFRFFGPITRPTTAAKSARLCERDIMCVCVTDANKYLSLHTYLIHWHMHENACIHVSLYVWQTRNS